MVVSDEAAHEVAKMVNTGDVPNDRDQVLKRAFCLLPSQDPPATRGFTAEAVWALSSARGRAKVPFGRCVERWRADPRRNG